MLIDILVIVATSWPITVMVVGVSAAFVIRRSLKQAMDNADDVRNLRAVNSELVRARDD